MTEENNEAQPVEEPTETPEVEVKDYDEQWDNALENAFTEASEPEVKDPETPFPSEEAVEEAPEVEETPEPEPELDEVIQAQGSPFRFTRNELRQVEKDVLIPLRDPDVAIGDVRTALQNFHPRFGELEQAIVNDSAEKHPDLWISALLGQEGLTVSHVKDLMKQGSERVASVIAGQSDTERYLNERYGDDWKDTSKDNDLLPEDVAAAVAQRRVYELESIVKNGSPDVQNKLKELEELKPQIEQLRALQAAEAERMVTSAYQSSVDTYRSAIETRVLPKMFTDSGLAVAEGDNDQVKAVKEGVQAFFQPVYGQASEFDLFLTEGFSQKESFQKMVVRVDGYLAEAAKAEYQAKTDPAAAAKAQGLRKQAETEKDAIAVMTRSAVKEFLDSPRVKGQMSLLEYVADLERRFAQTQRGELIGSTATAGNADAWKDELKNSDDPWDLSLIGERLSQHAR